MARHTSFASFSVRMAAIAAGVPVHANRIKQRAALLLDSELVQATPVDTGRARSNWVISLDSPTDRIRNVQDPQYTPGAEEEGIVHASVPGQDIYVSNNLPYIGALNNGWSAQAPAGFVEDAIQRVKNFITTQKVLRK